jgi:hypothetical protein
MAFPQGKGSKMVSIFILQASLYIATSDFIIANLPSQEFCTSCCKNEKYSQRKFTVLSIDSQ